MTKLYGPPGNKHPRSWYIRKYPNTNVAGFEEVMNNLNLAIKKMKKKSEEGLIEAAQFIRHDTETKPYATPVDYGNLRASWFIVSPKGETVDKEKLSGHFKNNPKRKISAATFNTWHTAAKTEARALTALDPKKISLMMGYSANYAMWVHEMMGANFKRTDPQAGPKWFQEAIDRNQDKIKKIIAENSRIK